MDTDKPLAPREFNRYEPVHWGTKVNVSAGSQKIRAEVVDESLSGLGLLVKGTVPFAERQSVIVDNGSFGRPGTVAYIGSAGEGAMRLGIQWVPHTEYRPV
jgi:hypothetical protein